MIYMRATTEPWTGGLEEQANRLSYVCKGSGTLAWPDSSCPAHARRIECTHGELHLGDANSSHIQPRILWA